MKYTTLLVMLTLQGCGFWEESKNQAKDYNHKGISSFEKVCLNGVMYYSRVRTHNTYFAVAYNKYTSQVILCDWDGVKEKPNDPEAN